MVTSDRLFPLAGDERTLKRANRLTPDDVLVAPSGAPVSVTAVHIGDWRGIPRQTARGQADRGLREYVERFGRACLELPGPP